MGCHKVEEKAENYEAIYFLSDEEILDAAARYRRWWETRKYPRTAWTIDPCYDEPLCGSGYRWWLSKHLNMAKRFFILLLILSVAGELYT